MSDSKLYIVVEYIDENSIYVIPHSWLRGSEAYWPPYVRDEQCKFAAKSMETPCNNWKLYRVKEWAQSCKLYSTYRY